MIFSETFPKFLNVSMTRRWIIFYFILLRASNPILSNVGSLNGISSGKSYLKLCNHPNDR